MKKYTHQLLQDIFDDDSLVQKSIGNYICSNISYEEDENEDEINKLIQKMMKRAKKVATILAGDKIIELLKDKYQEKEANPILLHYYETMNPIIKIAYTKFADYIFRKNNLNEKRVKVILEILQYNLSFYIKEKDNESISKLENLLSLKIEDILDYLNNSNKDKRILVENYFISCFKDDFITSFNISPEYQTKDFTTILDKYDQMIEDVFDYCTYSSFDERRVNSFIRDRVFYNTENNAQLSLYFESTQEYKTYLNIYLKKIILNTYLYLSRKKFSDLTEEEKQIFSIALNQLKANELNLKALDSDILVKLLSLHFKFKKENIKLNQKQKLQLKRFKKIHPLCYIDYIN